MFRIPVFDANDMVRAARHGRRHTPSPQHCEGRCGPDVGLFGPTTGMFGPTTRTCGPDVEVFGPTTGMFGPATGMCGPTTGRCGPARRGVSQHPAFLFVPPTHQDEHPQAPPKYPANRPHCCSERRRGEDQRHTTSIPPELLVLDSIQSTLANLFLGDDREPQQESRRNNAAETAKPSQHHQSTSMPPELLLLDSIQATLGSLFQGENGEPQETLRNNAGGATAKPPRHDQSQTTRKSPVMDILTEMIKRLTVDECQRKTPQKWRQVVDCTGFKSENIFIKVLNGSVVVRGVKEESSSDGSTCSTQMEKLIKLPQNANPKEVSCRLLADAKLVIEAPIIDRRSTPEQRLPTEKKGKPDVPTEKKGNKEVPTEKNGNPEGKQRKTKRENQLRLKFLPNGALLYGVVPTGKDNHENTPKKPAKLEAEPNANPDSHMNEKKTANNKEEVPITDDKEGTVPVTSSPPDQEESAESSAHKEAEDTKLPTSDVDKDTNLEQAGPQQVNHQEHEQSAEAPNTDPFVATSQVEDAKTMPICPDLEQECPYTVETPIGEDSDDASSQASDATDTSFVLIPESDKADEEPGAAPDHSAAGTGNKDQDQDQQQSANSMDDLSSMVGTMFQNIAREFSHADGADVKSGHQENVANVIQNLAQYVSQNAPEDLKNLLMDRGIPFPDTAGDHLAHTQTTETANSQASDYCEPGAKQSDTATNSSSVEAESDTDSNSEKFQAESSTGLSSEMFQVRLDMPLHGPESIRVTMDDKQGLVVIRANSDAASSSPDSVLKTISVPDTVQADKLTCHFQDGLLTIRAPFKDEDTKSTRNIPIDM